MGGALARSQAPGEGPEVALRGGEALGAHALEEGPLDQSEAHLAREVVDRRVAALRRGDQAIEEGRQVRHRREGGGLALEEALEEQ